jgi:hypothetical protein
MKRQNAVEEQKCGNADRGGYALDNQDRYLTSREVAIRWRRHPSTIRRMFIDEPGVLRFSNSNRRGKRQYVELRIPESLVRQIETRSRVKECRYVR